MSYLEKTIAHFKIFESEIVPHSYFALTPKRCVDGSAIRGNIYRVYVPAVAHSDYNMVITETEIFAREADDTLLRAIASKSNIIHRFYNPEKPHDTEKKYIDRIYLKIEHKNHDIFSFFYRGYQSAVFDYRIRHLVLSGAFSAIDADLTKSDNHFFLAKVVKPQLLVQYKLEQE